MTPQEEKNFDRKMKRWVIIIAVVGLLSGCVSNALSETLDWARFGLGLTHSSNQQTAENARAQGALEQRVTANERLVLQLAEQMQVYREKIARMEPVMERMGKWLDRQGVE